MQDFNKYFDHTLLKPTATNNDILLLCKEAIDYNFCSVCVPSRFVPLAWTTLADTAIKTTTVVGFPLGNCHTSTKVQEAICACDNGANEIDMVIPIGAIKEMECSYVLSDIGQVAKAISKYGATLKAILETSLLDEDEIVLACNLAIKAGADFIKTSTGFASGGADVETISLIRSVVNGRALIKASGGISTRADALSLIAAGANRLGTSQSIKIINEK